MMNSSGNFFNFKIISKYNEFVFLLLLLLPFLLLHFLLLLLLLVLLVLLLLPSGRALPFAFSGEALPFGRGSSFFLLVGELFLLGRAPPFSF